MKTETLMERIKPMSTLQKVLRYEELTAQLNSHLASIETEPAGTVASRIEGVIDEMVAVRSASPETNGRVATRQPTAKTTTVSKATAVSDTGGKGRKECPSCHKFVGARAQTCPACNHSFVTGQKAEPAAATADGEKSQGRRAKGESLTDKLKEILHDAASDGRRKEPSLDLVELLEKLLAKGYRTAAKEKNFRVAVQARLGDLVKKGEVLKSEDRKYSLKVETDVA